MSAAEAKTPETALDWALFYSRIGWNVVPVRPPEKLPAVAWARFQSMPADEATIRGWFDAIPGCGVGLVQGRNAGTVALDFDGEDGAATRAMLEARGLPAAPTSLTGSGGAHLLVRHPGRHVPTRKKVLPGMDVRGDGGFIVAPPSVHGVENETGRYVATGRQYAWDVDAHPEDMPVPDCPEWLADIICGPVQGDAAQSAEIIRLPTRGSLGISGELVSDGRETYMRDTILAVCRDLRDKLSRLPTDAELIEAAWPQYAARVDFTRPGRGRHEFEVKARYTLARATRGAIHGFEAEPEGGSADPLANNAEASPKERPAPSPIWVDADTWNPAAVPRRPWVAPSYLMRGSVSVLSGQGAGGKSSLVVAWTLSLASGRAIGAFEPVGPCRVVNYNVEDDRDEQHRRYGAALTAQDHAPAEVMPSIVRCGPHDVGTLFERDPATGRVAPTLAMAALERVCMETEADVLVCDPLAELHNAEENDNTAMRAVVAAFRSLAQRLGIAVLILHHDRKGSNAPGEMDRMRGASAISGAVRVMLTLTTMSAEEADRYGVPPDLRRRHFRIDGAKSNYAVASEAEWWKLDAYPIGNGEEVASALPWQPPSAFGDLSLAACVSVLARIRAGTDAGLRWGATKQAGDDWAGRLLMAEPHSRTEGQAAAILGTWEAEGLLAQGAHPSPRRGHSRKAYTVDEERFAEMRRHAGEVV